MNNQVVVAVRGYFDPLHVGHVEFFKMSSKKIISLFTKPSLLIDVKNIWSKKKLPDYISKWSL